MMSEYIIGAHILGSLTTGMYQDSRMIFREYIQNSCDAVDAAVRSGLLESGEDDIRITIDSTARKITIEDNGTGIKSDDFARILGNVAYSSKRQDANKGFRGIGRLAGMGYCKMLIFTAKFKGENVVSSLVCNAGVIRELLNVNNSGIERYSASQVLDFFNEFKTETTEDTDAHYFRVELEGINEGNTDLLDVRNIREYLSFIAPLPYSIAFMPFSTEIHEHAKKLGLYINEYNIYVNDEQLFKRYTQSLSTSMGEDEIFALSFKEFRDKDNNLIAWIWFGLSRFWGVIKKKYAMRGIRLRKGNIQVGNNDALQKFFIEDRGINYFIGELFCVSDELILNAHRDYFEENPARYELEVKIKDFFSKLKKIYYDSSRVNSSFNKIDEAGQEKAELTKILDVGNFTDEEGRNRTMLAFRQAEKKERKARAEISRLKTEGGYIIKAVIEHIEDMREKTQASQPSRLYQQDNYTPAAQTANINLRKIFEIIRETTDAKTADRIITKIETALQ